MTARDDKRSRKEALAKWKSQQRATARAKLPLDNALMKEMFDMLDAELSDQDCDHTLRLVRSWCLERSLSTEPVEAWLRENGGFCDCEALANAEQAWQEATHDSDDN